MALLSSNGSISLFRVAGIRVALHWSWILVAFFQIAQRRHEYTSLSWNIAEYLALFMIVLLHEFGHAFACRSVGGQANYILLWPLGGIAFVSPPSRPGAHLWSIAAGPLVNVLLVGLSFLILTSGFTQSFFFERPDLFNFFQAVSFINLVILLFNILPIYPLDGGQILRSLLWFAIGPHRSLLVASVIGIIGAAGFTAYAIEQDSPWMMVLALFLGWHCVQAFKAARGYLKKKSEDSPQSVV